MYNTKRIYTKTQSCIIYNSISNKRGNVNKIRSPNIMTYFNNYIINNNNFNKIYIYHTPNYVPIKRTGFSVILASYFGHIKRTRTGLVLLRRKKVKNII